MTTLQMMQLVFAGLELKAARWGLTPAELRAHERLAVRLDAIARGMGH